MVTSYKYLNADVVVVIIIVLCLKISHTVISIKCPEFLCNISSLRKMLGNQSYRYQHKMLGNLLYSCLHKMLGIIMQVTYMYCIKCSEISRTTSKISNGCISRSRAARAILRPDLDLFILHLQSWKSLDLPVFYLFPVFSPNFTTSLCFHYKLHSVSVYRNNTIIATESEIKP